MARLILRCLFFVSFVFLLGCPAKDWVKRDDAYLSVEQYKNMTEVIRINDSLYRVKKGEELNQNKITQLFVDFQVYKNSSIKMQREKKRTMNLVTQSSPSVFNVIFHALILIDTQGQSDKARALLHTLKKVTVSLEDKKLLHLAGLLQAVLKKNHQLLTRNSKLNAEIKVVTGRYELALEEMLYLNKQVNDLKSIEDSLHSRELKIELESR